MSDIVKGWLPLLARAKTSRNEQKRAVAGMLMHSFSGRYIVEPSKVVTFLWTDVLVKRSKAGQKRKFDVTEDELRAVEELSMLDQAMLIVVGRVFYPPNKDVCVGAAVDKEQLFKGE